MTDKEIAWKAWREAWNQKGSMNYLSQIEEDTARGAFKRWWKNNYD